MTKTNAELLDEIEGEYLEHGNLPELFKSLLKIARELQAEAKHLKGMLKQVKAFYPFKDWDNPEEDEAWKNL